MATKTIGLLPSETLLIIFSYLDFDDLFSCTLVSKLWSALAKDPSLWRHFHIIKKNINMSLREIEKWTSIPRLSKVENLDIYGCFNHEEFANYAVYNHNYLSLNWPSYSAIIAEEHFEVLSKASAIKHISISFCEIDYCDSFIKCARTLSKLHLSDCIIGSDQLESLAMYIDKEDSNLKSFKLDTIFVDFTPVVRSRIIPPGRRDSFLNAFSKLEELEIVLVMDRSIGEEFFQGDFISALFKKLDENPKMNSLKLDSKEMFRINRKLFANVINKIEHVNLLDAKLDGLQIKELLNKIQKDGTNIKSLCLERLKEETLFWNIQGYMMVSLNKLKKIELINPDFDCFQYHSFFFGLKEGTELNYDNSLNSGDMPFERDYGSVPKALSRLKKARIARLNRQQMVTAFEDVVRSDNLVLKDLTLDEMTPLYSSVYIHEHQIIAEGINKLEKFSFSHKNDPTSIKRKILPLFVQKMFLIMSASASNLKDLSLKRVNLSQLNTASPFHISELQMARCLKNLRTLSLIDANLNESQMKTLFQVLSEESTSLSYLNLSMNKLHCVNTNHLVRVSSKVNKLILEDTNLQDEQIVKLLERIKNKAVCKYPDVLNIKYNNSCKIDQSLIMEVHRKIKIFQIDIYLDNDENTSSDSDFSDD